MNQLMNVKSKNPVPQQALIEAVNSIIQAHYDYNKIVEIEKSKREMISSWRDVQLKKLDDQRGLVESYLVQVFGERAYVISQLFQRLDDAIEDEDLNRMNLCLGGIVDLAKQSPLAGIGELIAQYNDQSVEKLVI